MCAELLSVVLDDVRERERKISTGMISECEGIPRFFFISYSSTQKMLLHHKEFLGAKMIKFHLTFFLNHNSSSHKITLKL